MQDASLYQTISGLFLRLNMFGKLYSSTEVCEYLGTNHKWLWSMHEKLKMGKNGYKGGQIFYTMSEINKLKEMMINGQLQKH
jgi:hypothetical protein